MRTQRRSTRVSAFHLTPLVAAIVLALQPHHAAAACIAYEVKNIGDNLGANPSPDACTGTLRQAIVDANFHCASVPNPIITFKIPGSGPFVIAVSSSLPVFSCPTGTYTPTVDGTTQTGSVANSSSTSFNATIPVAVDGFTSYGGDGFHFDSASSGFLAVKGLEFKHFNTALQGKLFAKGNKIHGNTTGVLVSGATGSGSGVGGSLAADRNWIIGNTTGASFSSVSNISVTNNLFDSNGTGASFSSVTTFSVLGNSFVANTDGIVANTSNAANIQSNFFGSLDGTSSTVSGNSMMGIDWMQSLGSIQNNNFTGNGECGIHFNGDTGTNFANNTVGTDITGTSALGNGYGVMVDLSDGPHIQNNVISGNLYGGVLVNSDSGSLIQNNNIGTNLAGSAALANGTAGGVSMNSSHGTSIQSNLISGNLGAGLSLFNSNNIVINTNTVGTNLAATAALANARGIVAVSGFNETIQNNLIAGNNGDGLTLQCTNGPGSPPLLAAPIDGNKILPSPNIVGNRIGVVSFTTSIPNTGNGIVVEAGDCFPNSSGNGFFQNWVANNLRMGITLLSGTGNTLGQNAVYNNIVKNIDINNNYGGPLPNDINDCGIPPGSVPGSDCDTGPNNQQNYPDNVTVAAGPPGTTIGFMLASTPSRSFHVEIFDNPAMPAHPAGKRYRADTFVTTDANGNSPPGSFTLGDITNYITLTATDTVTGDTSEFSLVGSYVPTPAVSMSASSLDFGSVNVGQTSGSQSVTLASTGSAPYHINAFDSAPTCYGGPVCVGGDFTCVLGCSTATSYAPGASCTISATFHPSTAGSKTSSIYVCDNATGSPRLITLTGNGVAATSNVTISPATFDFGNVLVGQAGAGQDFFVTNSGTGAASVTSISPSGDFNMLNTTCSGQLAPNASCKATVAFAPTLPGLRSGALTATMSNGTASASLKGTGTQQAVLDMPSSVDFGSLTLGSGATSLIVTLRNTGNAVITLSSISVSGPFTLTNPCPLNLVPGASCTLTLEFNPTTVGDFTGTLTVVSNASGGSRNIPITAHSVPQPIPLIRVSPGFIGFGDRMIGTQSAAQRIQIRNEGGVSAPVDLTTRSTDFLIVGASCGATIAAQGTCFADIVFQPGGFGGRVGQFRVNSVSTADGQVTDLVGTGCRPFIPGTSRAHQQSNCSP